MDPAPSKTNAPRPGPSPGIKRKKINQTPGEAEAVVPAMVAAVEGARANRGAVMAVDAAEPGSEAVSGVDADGIAMNVGAVGRSGTILSIPGRSR